MPDSDANVNVDGRPAPWSGIEILAAMYMVWYVWPVMVSLVLKGVGVERWYYGEDTPQLSLRLGLWVHSFAMPWQLLSVLLLFSAFSGARPNQLGLTTRHFGRNLLAGVAGLLVLSPLVFGLFQLLRYLYSQSGEHAVQQHDLEIIAQTQLFPSEWLMLFFSAMVSAPVLEELMFRGVLQPWLAQRHWGGHAAMSGALLLSLLSRWPQWQAIRHDGAQSLLTAAMPALFVLALLPIYFFVYWRSRTPLGPALFGTALLFAYIHAAVWPTPIPLFILSLGLGVLAYRSGSLVGPIVLHSLFNGISCVQLLAGW